MMNKKLLFLNYSLLLAFVALPVLAVQINNPLASATFGDLLTRIAEGIAGLVGVLSGIMIIIAGIMYLTSAGDQQKMNNAKNALKYAIIGIVLALIAIPIVETIKTVLGVTSTS